MEHILTTKGTMPKPEAISGASIPEYIEVKATDGSTVAFLSPEADGVEAWIDDEQNATCTLEMELPLTEEVKSYQSGWQEEIAQTVSAYWQGSLYISMWLAQGFKPTGGLVGANKIRGQVRSYGKSGTPPDTHWYVYNDNNGVPGISITKNYGIVTGEQWPTSTTEWATAEIELEESLQDGQQYWLVLSAQGEHNTSNLVKYLYTKGDVDVYPDGCRATSINGATWFTSNHDLVFKLDAPVYEDIEKSPWQYLTDQYRIYADGKEFVILNPDAVDKQRDGKKLKGKIKAHESWVLLGKKFPTISNDPQNPSPPWGAVIIVSGGAAHGGFDPGSAGSALSYLLQGTGWTVGTVDVTGTYDLETEKESVLYNINQVQEKWGGILVWDSVNHTVSLRDEETWQNYTGYQIRYAKNLKGISRADDYDIVTRLYPFGENDLNIANVNGGLLYLDNQSYSTEVLEGVWYNQDIADQTQLKTQGEKQLAVMCRPRHNYKTEVLDLRSLPGYGHETFKRSDMVDLLDEDFGVNARVRIIRYRHNVFQPWLCDMELGDPIEKIQATVAQTVLMAKFYKNVVAPNTSFQNLLKAIINTEATEINGASGDYTLIDGVSTWKDPDTGDLTRATPKGLIISSDGGQTWKTAISGKGIHADAGWVGKLNAGVVTVGADTTFEAGYDPTKGSMGVDADCVGLWHFDGSLNSHKGVTAIGNETFDTGCFGQAVKVEEGTTNVILDPSFENADISANWNNANGPNWSYTAKTVRTRDVTYKKYGSASAKCGDGVNNGTYGVAETNQGTSAHPVSAGQKWSLSFSAYVADAEQIISLIRFYDSPGNNVSGTITLPSGWSYSAYYQAVHPTGTPVSPQANIWTDYSFSFTVPSGVAFAAISLQYHAEGTVKYVWFDGVQFEEKDQATAFVEGTRPGGLKIPTAGMSASQGTISFRISNLSTLDTYVTLLELPDSSNSTCFILWIDGGNRLCLTYKKNDGSTVAIPGPSKSSFNNWDLISISWGSSRLSLSINDAEVGFAIDHLLPSELWNCIYIGNNRFGNNAVNAVLIDELRIDKVYHDAATRIAWHKTGVPFYTSEDMKQWPGYIRAETDGLKVYDSENALRVLVGSWLKDQIRKYGIKIIGGEIYSTSIQSGEEGAADYIRLGEGFTPFQVVKSNKPILELYAFDDAGMLKFSFVDPYDLAGEIYAFDDDLGKGLKIYARGNSAFDKVLMLEGYNTLIYADNEITLRRGNNIITVDSNKTACSRNIEFSNAYGPVVTSSNGTKWQIRVDNDGNVLAYDV